MGFGRDAGGFEVAVGSEVWARMRSVCAEQTLSQRSAFENLKMAIANIVHTAQIANLDLKEPQIMIKDQ